MIRNHNIFYGIFILFGAGTTAEKMKKPNQPSEREWWISRQFLLSQMVGGTKSASGEELFRFSSYFRCY